MLIVLLYARSQGKPREFSSGGKGWYTGGKIEMFAWKQQVDNMFKEIASRDFQEEETKVEYEQIQDEFNEKRVTIPVTRFSCQEKRATGAVTRFSC